MALHGLEGWKDRRGVHPDRNFRLTETLTLSNVSGEVRDACIFNT